MARKHPPVTPPAEAGFPHAYDILMDAPIGVFTSTPEGRYLFGNNSLAQMLGYETPGELINSVTDIAAQVYANPDDRQEFIRLMQKHGKVVDHECLFRRKDGTEFWVSMNACAVRDEDGRVEAYQGFATNITRRKDLEEQYRGIFNASKDAMLIFDTDGVIREVNQAACAIYGYTHDEMLGLSGRDIVHPDYQHLFKEFVNKSASNEMFLAESVDIRKDGSTFCIDVKGGALMFRNRPHLLGIVRDITERKRAEEALRESEEKHRRLFETMAQGVIYQAADSSIISANPAAERILGLSFDQMQGKTSMDPLWKMIREDGTAVPGADHPAMIALRTGETVGPAVMGVFHPDRNDHIWLSITAIPLYRSGETKPFQAYATFEDITDRKRAEEALQNALEDAEEGKRTLDALMAHIPVGITIADASMRLLRVSRHGLEMMGWPIGRHIGLSVEEILSQWEVFLADGATKARVEELPLPRAIMCGETVLGQEIVQHHADGRVIPLTCDAGPIRNSEGQITGGIIAWQDITERKRAEENIRAVNEQLTIANIEKDKLFAIIAHDLKSPMCGLLASTEMLASQTDIFSENEIRRLSTELHKNAKNTFELMEDLLQWSRMNQGGIDYAPAQCSLKELVNMGVYSAQNEAKRKDINISSNIPQGLTVLADQPMIKTVIRNILFNAIKFTPRQGEIVITARQSEQMATVSVQDNGIGMNKQALSSIFALGKEKQQLGTEGEKGTGLGLMLCKQFVEKHGGQIWTESEPGKGTTVFFTLQVSD